MSKPDTDNKRTSMTGVYVYFALAFVSIIILGGFYIFGHNLKDIRQAPESSPVLPGITGKVNQGLQARLTPEETMAEPAAEYDDRQMEDMIREFSDNFPGNTGIIFHDFETGFSVRINPHKVFESASLVKLPIMLTIYEMMEQGKVHASQEIILNESHKTGGAGILKNEPTGTRWSVDKLLELMITESDNTATDMLIELAGMDTVEETCRSMGMDKTTLKRKIFDFDAIEQGYDNLTTPGDIFRFYQMLYEGCPINPQGRASMLNRLKRQERNHIIPKNLPNVEIAHKTGSLTGIIHDAGVIYPPKRKPYILILMSDGVSDHEKAEAEFARLSGEIFRIITEEQVSEIETEENHHEMENSQPR